MRMGGVGNREPELKVIYVEKAKMYKNIKSEKWKSVRIPETLWRIIRMEAAKKGIKIYKEIEWKYEQTH